MYKSLEFSWKRSSQKNFQWNPWQRGIDEYKSREISAAYLDYFVSFAEAGHVRRRIWIHFANVLARPILLCMEVEAVALEVRPLDDMTQTRPRRWFTHCKDDTRSLGIL